MRKEQGDLKVTRDLLAFYLAHVMAATEDFITTQSPWHNFDFSTPDKDHLIFQLAVPTGLLDNDGATESLFQKSFIAAFELRHTVDPDMRQTRLYPTWTSEVAKVTDPGLKSLKTKFQWQCLIYPEVLAAMQAVFRSPNPQQDGLYLTMDVGAGTVELNSFRRNTWEHLPPGQRADAPRNHDYYSLTVAPLGIHNFRKPYALVTPRSLQEVMVELHQEIRTIYHKATLRQPNQGRVRGNRTWDRARFLILGGGAKIRAYRECFHKALDDIGIHRPQVFDLPAASDLQFPPTIDFGRFAVAYGMSFFRKNLDDWRPPNEIRPFNDLYPPVDRPPRTYGFNWED